MKLNGVFQVIVMITSIVAAIGNPIDPSTYANIDQVKGDHMEFNFQVDFDRQAFVGKVTHTMTVLEEKLKSVFFDSQGIKVERAEFITVHGGCQIWQDVNFNVTRPNDNLGDAVEVHLPYDLPKSTGIKIRLTYQTNDQTTAINWLKPSQTSGKKLPYVFTQCEDIACRSIAPMQDTPAVKVTYEATVIVKNDFKVYMSANQTGTVFWNSTHTAFRFSNQIKMAPYLIAIAVGDLEYRSLGSRTGVITEPSNMEAVASELASLPELLDRTEKYLTDYIWGNYSILVLPPSFPFGGMENPLLTFASPTIITGDKSQVYVATHEIAHSWTGNQVTCENWSNMWLNEGFTVFEERKVSAQIHGKDFSMVNAYLGNISMVQDMQPFGLDSNYSSLYPQIGANKPDDAFSLVVYEKGFQLLYYLESLLGEDHMESLIQQHIRTYSQQSINYKDFIKVFEDYLTENFAKDKANKIRSQMDWEAWIKGPGLAPVHLDFKTKEVVEAQSLASEYIKLKGAQSPANYTDYKGYYSSLKVVFLEQLVSELPGNKDALAILKKIDADLSITQSLDPECKQRWYPLGIKLKYDAVVEPAHQFISSQGRMKYLTPIYTALLDTKQKSLAVKWFNENKNFYHPLAVDKLKALIGVKDVAVPEAKNSLVDSALVLWKQMEIDEKFGKIKMMMKYGIK